MLKENLGKDQFLRILLLFINTGVKLVKLSMESCGLIYSQYIEW